ncbi:MAG: iron ABC transporter permease [Caldimonas sp.]
MAAAMARARAEAAWLSVGALSFVLLPWYAAADTSLWQALAGVWAGPESASGFVQAVRHGRPWLAAVALGIVVAAFGLRAGSRRRQGTWLVAGASIALGGILVAGFAIGATGWSFAVLTRAFGALPVGQVGIGLGGATTLVALLVVLGAGLARLGWVRGDAFTASAIVVCSALLLLFVAYPVARALGGAFVDESGAVSLGGLWGRIGNERTWGLGCFAGGVRCGVAWNTLFLALLTAAGTTLLGTLIALLAERGSTRLKRGLNALALLPIITPPFVLGLGLILLFGRAGIVNQGLEAAFGITPSRWFYGWFGIWLAQLFAFTPIAFMIVRGVVAGIAPSLEEAAQTLRADRRKTFFTITLPLLKPGLANAFLVGFIESIADFGNPVVVGGQFSVLSTEVFFAIVGAQYDEGRAASLALVLSAFALLVFWGQRRLLGTTAFTTVTGKGENGLPMPLPDGLRRAALAVVVPWLAFTLVVYLFAFAGGFVQTWGRDYTPTLRHFVTAFDVQRGNADVGAAWVFAGTAWNSLFTTLKLSAIAAPLCAALGLVIAWLLARTTFRGRDAFEFGALLAFAIPGTVLGVSYILAFNVPPFELTGSGLIIVLCFVFRNLPVGVRAGSAAFRQIDRSLDEASTMLRARTATTLRRVVAPLLRPALVAALIYSFVRSMTTVSAVVFLVTAETELATTYIIGRVGNGDYGVALAYCTVLIALMSLAVALINWSVGERAIGRRALVPVPA